MAFDDFDTRFSLFQEKTKNFNRSFAILLGVTIFFFFFIFLPYFSILDKTHELINQIISTRNLENNLLIFKNNILHLNDTIYNDNKTIVNYYKGITDSVVDNVRKCDDHKYAQRLIQTTTAKSADVKQYIKDSAVGKWDICYIIAKAKDTNTKFVKNNSTILSFYNNSIQTGQHNAYADFVPKSYKENYVSPVLDKNGISSLEFYGSSYYVGSPFWLNGNLKNKINVLFDNHTEQINVLQKNIDNFSKQMQLTSQPLDNSSFVRILKINQNLNKLNNSLPILKNYYFEKFNTAFND